MGKRITISEGWGVYVNGDQVPGGSTVAVDDTTADHWIARGWATEAKPVKAAAKAPAATRAPAGTRVPAGRAAKARNRKP